MATLNLNKKNVPLVLLLMLILLHAHSQQSPDSLYNVFKQHVLFFQNKYKELYWDDEVKLAYYNLIEKSTNNYLIRLTDDENPAIRANVYAGLVMKIKDTLLLKKILDKHAGDTSQFTEVYKDFGSGSAVNDFMKMQFDFKIKHPVNTTHLLDRYEAIKLQPRWFIRGVSHGYITTKNLLLLDSLIYSAKNVTVDSFQLFTGDTSLISTSNKLTAEMKRVLSTLHAEDLVTFDVIKGTDEEKQRVRLPSISLWIKE